MSPSDADQRLPSSRRCPCGRRRADLGPCCWAFIAEFPLDNTKIGGICQLCWLEEGAVHIWGGNSREGNSCRRRRNCWPALGEEEGRHKACPYLPLFGGQGAGTRPAPTGALGGRAGTRPDPTFRCLEGRGQAQGLPLPFAVWRAGGRHKACPYLPLFGGQGAGTRPAPTGALGGRAGTRPDPTFRCLEGRGQAQGLTLPFLEWAALRYVWRSRFCSVLSC